MLLGQPVGLSLPAPEAQLPLGQRLLAVRGSPLPSLDLLQLSLLGAGPLLGTALQPVPFLAPPEDLTIEIFPQLERLHLGAEQQVDFGCVGLTLALRADPLGIRPRNRENTGGAPSLIPGVEQDEQQGAGQCRSHPRENRQEERR